MNVEYCCSDPSTKAKLEIAIQGGWEMWHGRLSNGGPGSSHSLVGFSETKHDGSMVFWLDFEQEECKSKHLP